MNEGDFLYVVRTRHGFDQAVVSVLATLEKKGWSLFNVYDIQERLAAKGFRQEPLKIIEFCNAKAADALLIQNRLISACMPCRIVVLVQQGSVQIVAMRPSVMAEFFYGVDVQTLKTVEDDIRQIVDDASKTDGKPGQTGTEIKL